MHQTQKNLNGWAFIKTVKKKQIWLKRRPSILECAMNILNIFLCAPPYGSWKPAIIVIMDPITNYIFSSIQRRILWQP